MNKLQELLKGKKTYIVALVMAVYAGSALLLGKISQNDAIELLMQAAAVAGLRLGIAGK